MLQIADLTEYEAKDIPTLLEKVRPIIRKRKLLHEKYSRKATDSKVMYTEGNNNTKIPFEKFITDLATGYLSGKPVYSVDISNDDERTKLLAELLDQDPHDDQYKQAMEIIIEYIASYNDDSTEHYELIHDILEMTACYEVIYENSENEIVYSKYSPLQTVATWDYSIPANLTGLVRVWEEEKLDGSPMTKVELTDVNGTRQYTVNGQEVSMDNMQNFNWGDVPAFAIETDYAIFETCEDIIQAYEQLIQNIRNTYQYNDSDCKLKLTGYTPENSMTIIDDDGEVIINPARQAEDKMWKNSSTIYVGEGGDVSWLIKDVDATGAETILKTYVDLMFQLAGIPNTSDLAFNSTDLNASAIDRKFYIMNMKTAEIVAQLKKAYLRRWELIFNRINLKKSTSFDFRNIKVELPKNLPNNDDELIDSMMKLKDVLSEQTIIEKLGYNYISEKTKKEEESASNMEANLERMKQLKESGLGNDEVTDDEVTEYEQQ